jgi:transcriptional regulator with XRE-family HTH domain
MNHGFGSRLREQRVRQHVDLRAIAAETKISESLLEALEEDDVSRWPSGIFRRAFIRAYAQAIHLNPDEVVREFLACFPDPLETVDTVAVAASVHAKGISDSSIDLSRAAAPRARAVGRRPAPVDPSLAAVAHLCGALARSLHAGEVPPLLEEAARIIGAAGLLLWRWEPQIAALQPWIGHGYPDAVIAQLPAVTRDDDNAVAAAFRGSGTHVVNGVGEMSGAVAVPLLASTGCVGVMALEFRNGGEQRESVRAVAEIIAAQLVHLVPHIQ